MGRPGTCGRIAALLFLLAIIGGFVRGFGKAIVMQQEREQEGQFSARVLDPESSYEAHESHGFWMSVTALGSMMYFAGLAITIALVASIRQTIRAKDQIRPGAWGGADDCCVATFCQCCAVSQMMRHVLTKWMGRAPTSYQLCSPTGYVSV